MLNKLPNLKISTYQIVSKRLIDYLVKEYKKNPDRSVKSLISSLEKIKKFAPKGEKENVINIINFLINLFKEKNPVVLGYYHKIFTKAPKVREKFLINYLVRASLVGRDKRKMFSKTKNLPAPFFFVISPTMRCNLRCQGCYAAKYKKRDELSYEVIDKIFSDAKQMGIYFITVSGGEPFLRDDLLLLFQKHNDIYFQVFTNGTLINKKLAQKLADLGNVAPVISVEGLEKETSQRRGKMVFQKICQAMDNLKEAGVIFGYSTMPCQYNWQILLEDKFYQFLERKGALFGWFFQYIPVGRKPDPRLMLTPKQRIEINKKVHQIRKSMSLFAVDFWTDGPYVKGCLAAGRDNGGYFHINVYGDIEPCVFVHFAQDNIKDIYARGGHLWDVLSSDFFCRIREGQPWNADHRMPCMIIDNPECLRKIVKETKPYPTYPEAKNIICSSQIVNYLDKYSCRLSKILFKER
jgi:MoaA/NifB/PqqE/SkfB family radical SAM enzyme